LKMDAPELRPETVLFQKLVSQLQEEWPLNDAAPFYRLEAPSPEFDLISFLDAQTESPRIFWADRETPYQVAAVGAACDFKGLTNHQFDAHLAQIQTVTKNNSNLRFFGGRRFSSPEDSKEDDTWQHFGHYRFILPAIEFTQNRDRFSVAINLPVQPLQTIEHYIQYIQGTLHNIDMEIHTPEPISSLESRLEAPTETEWIKRISQLKRTIASTDLEKLVLARKVTYKFSDSISPFSILHQLMIRNDPGFYFAFSNEQNESFLGCSPEMLYHREHRHIKSEAIAGTEPRLGEPDEDLLVEQNLKVSKKDFVEHQFVRNMIFEKLKTCCEDLQMEDENRVLRLSYVRHLICAFSGRLKANVSDESLLKLLHPTPAVCGEPYEAALAAIHHAEPFDRGLYSGLVGWIGRDASKFAVAIRSCLVRANQVDVFSGAGIVDSSDPEKEWAEINHKIAPFDSILSMKKPS
ncbi:MAG: menaquinone-specific isochorismate synthase, partial [Candidatus Marinamargulisbacteria bacterium]